MSFRDLYAILYGVWWYLSWISMLQSAKTRCRNGPKLSSEPGS